MLVASGALSLPSPIHSLNSHKPERGRVRKEEGKSTNPMLEVHRQGLHDFPLLPRQSGVHFHSSPILSSPPPSETLIPTCQPTSLIGVAFWVLSGWKFCAAGYKITKLKLALEQRGQ